MERILDAVEECVTHAGRRPVLLGGDFNAHVTLCGSPSTDIRGRILSAWAARLGLICLNRGSRPTCVRPQGSSIVDLTFGSPAIAARARDWRVLPAVTLSDHRYVHVALSEMTTQRRWGARPRERRWRLGALNDDLLQASLITGAMVHVGDPIAWNLEEEAIRLRSVLVRACDVAMPRARPQPVRAMPWWSQDLAELRREVVAARRAVKRVRRRRHRHDEEEVEHRVEMLRLVRRTLRTAIAKAKSKA